MFSDKEELLINKIESICAASGYVKAEPMQEINESVLNDAVNLVREVRKQNKKVWKLQKRDEKGRFLTYEGAKQRLYTIDDVHKYVSKAKNEMYTRTQLKEAVDQACESLNQEKIALSITIENKEKEIQGMKDGLFSGIYNQQQLDEIREIDRINVINEYLDSPNFKGKYTEEELSEAIEEAVEIALAGIGDKQHDCVEAISEAFLAGMNGRGNSLLLPSKKLELYLHSKGLK
jgi:hypothetical protein